MDYISRYKKNVDLYRPEEVELDNLQTQSQSIFSQIIRRESYKNKIQENMEKFEKLANMDIKNTEDATTFLNKFKELVS